MDMRSNTRHLIALAGNPNVGKSTLFNQLTGLRQHTGNWPGKTVDVAKGKYVYKGKCYDIVDLPGTYSLHTRSEEEEITVNFIHNSDPDLVLIVCDATNLERNLILALQIVSLTSSVILCVNLLDEARRNDMMLDLTKLEHIMGIPVIGISASSGEGLNELKDSIRKHIDGFGVMQPVNYEKNEIPQKATWIADQVLGGNTVRKDSMIDRIVLGKWTGYGMIFLLLLAIFWLTICGANYLSEFLEAGFGMIGNGLQKIISGLPGWLFGLIMDGIYGVISSVISVMLPPMLIFFPLFSILEDFGYLPRISFLMDHFFEKCGTCGKQSLTMAMGFGCNAVGVTGCRIIGSYKERLIAIITNSLVPCNGRFPTLILLVTTYLAGNSFEAALILSSIILLCVCMTLFTTAVLSNTMLKHNTYFVLELPPYRKPQIKQILIRAFWDRSIHVLLRALIVAAPAGVLIWVLYNVNIVETPLLSYFVSALDPIGIMLGMNGAILVAFILSFPANELLLPLVVMMQQGGFFHQYQITEELLVNSEISFEMAICMIIFTLFHWPCGTTCITIYRETKSWKWTIAAVLIPVMIGAIICLSIHFAIIYI